jgi:hypothetical protein
LTKITLSTHGITKESYEKFMQGASFETFHRAPRTIVKLKRKYELGHKTRHDTDDHCRISKYSKIAIMFVLHVVQEALMAEPGGDEEVPDFDEIKQGNKERGTGAGGSPRAGPAMLQGGPRGSSSPGDTGCRDVARWRATALTRKAV